MDANLTAGLPLRRSGDRPTPVITPVASWLSGTLAGIATLTSLLGLLAEWPYAAETENWRLQARGQDVGNLLAVAVLVIGLAGARRGSLRGLLLWLGSLFYLAYAFVLYAMTIHFGPLFLGYVACLGLAGYSIILTLGGQIPPIDLPRRAVRAASGVLLIIGVGFALLWLSGIGAALAAGRAPAELTEAGLVSNPVHVLDLALVLPAMVLTAVNARRGSPRARFLLAPWLVFAGLIGAGLVAAALLGGAPAALFIGFLLVTGISAGAAALVLQRSGSAQFGTVPIVFGHGSGPDPGLPAATRLGGTPRSGSPVAANRPCHAAGPFGRRDGTHLGLDSHLPRNRPNHVCPATRLTTRDA